MVGGRETKSRKKVRAAGANMHTRNHGKNKPHERNSCVSAGFSQAGLSVLQLLQALQGFSTSPDKAAQLDAGLQGGARAQFSGGPGQLPQEGLLCAGHDVCIWGHSRRGRPLGCLEPCCGSLTVLWTGDWGLRGGPRA